MRKFILTIGLSILSLKANSQIVVREEAKDSVVWYSKLAGLPKLVHFYGEEYSSYTLYYKNSKYQHITDIKYLSLGDKESAQQFFNIVKKTIQNGNKISLEINGELFIVSKSFNTAFVYGSSSSFMISKKQIENVLKALN
jgi:hypothetical protein